MSESLPIAGGGAVRALLPPSERERLERRARLLALGGNAWHLVKVLSVSEPGRVTYEKAHDQIRKYLLEEKRREAVTKAVDQAKYLMDIEIFKAELRPKEGPGSAGPLPKPLEPPARSPEEYRQAAPKAETGAAAAQ